MGARKFLWKWGGIVAVVAILVSAGCGYAPPTEPADQTDDSGLQGGNGRALWGLWEIFITPEGEALVMDARLTDFHVNVYDFLIPPNCNDCLIITVTEFLPTEHRVEADVTLKNDQPFVGYDVRGILISNVGHDLYNPDDYTDLWDDGGDVAINPFKRYPADPGPYIFPPGYTETNHYSVELPSPMQLASIKMAVDASWPSECKEPFNLGSKGKEAFGKLCEDGGDVNFYIDIFTHMSAIESVILDMSPLGGGEVELEPWDGVPGLFNYFAAFGVPFAGASEGEYELWVKAKTEASKLWLYDKFPVQILSGGEYIPKPIVVDVMDYPYTDSTVAVKDGNLYALGTDGLKVYSIGADGALSLISEAGAPPQDTNRYHLYLDQDLAFAFFERWEHLESKLAVYDISTPSDAQLKGVKEYLPILGSGAAVGEYLLCTVPAWKQLAYIDATDPDNPTIGTGANLSFAPYGLTRDGDLLFVILEDKGVRIYDITTPNSPLPKGTYQESKAMNLPITVSDNTGYLWTSEGKLNIFTYANPDFPIPVSTTVLNPAWDGDQFTGFHLDSNFLFGWGETCYVIAVSDPENPVVVFEPVIPELTPHTTQGMAFYGPFAYAPNEEKLEIIRSY